MSDKNPFDYFDKIFCINLDSRPDRWEQVQREFDKVGIRNKVERMPAVTKEEAIKKSSYKLKGDIPGQYGCCLSHHKCLEDAVKNNLDSYLVFEDDMILGNSFDSNFNLGNFNLNWQIFLFGYVEWNTKSKVNINDQICKIDRFGCTHSVGIKKSAFEILLDNFQRRVIDEKTHRKNWFKRIDYFYSFVCSEIYGLRKQMCFQREGFSDITNTNISRTSG